MVWMRWPVAGWFVTSSRRTFPPSTWRRRAAGGRRRWDGVQLDYSLVYRDRYEREAAELCATHGLGFIARSPLAGGYLVSSPPRRLGSFPCRTVDDPTAVNAAQAVWPTLASVAQAHRSSPSQIALAWVLGRPGVGSVLISARDVGQLRELIGAAAVELSPEDRRRLDDGVVAAAVMKQ